MFLPEGLFFPSGTILNSIHTQRLTSYPKSIFQKPRILMKVL